MNIEEAVRIIANYMGWIYDHNNAEYVAKGWGDFIPVTCPSRSLDTLIPVWEKANIFPVYDKCDDIWSCELWHISSLHHSFPNATSLDIFEATCLATGSAILELKSK